MTTKFQKRVRARMAKTGESYQTAFQSLHQETGAVDIVTFVEHEMGANLFPVQQVLLKVLYGLALNDKKKISIRTSPTESQEFTEASYLRHLYDEGRSCIAEVIPGKPFREAQVAIGRRSGKTFLMSCIMAWELYQLLQFDDVHKRYGLHPYTTIGLTCVGLSKDQAGLLGDEIGHHLARGPFDLHRGPQTKTSFKFQTGIDIRVTGRYGQNREARYGIKAHVLAATSKGLHGIGSKCVLFDELAHFPNNTGEEHWSALAPAVAAFTLKDEKGWPLDEKNAQSEGSIFAFSTPYEKKGYFYRRFQRGMEEGGGHTLSLQLPSWEMNPTISAHVFLETKERDEALFRQEYGAEFLDLPPPPKNADQELLQRTLDELTTQCSYCERSATWSGMFVVCDTRDPGPSSCDGCLSRLRAESRPNRSLTYSEKRTAGLIRAIEKQLR